MAFGAGMRFSSTQLRMLQETLTPPVPPLEAPPELQRTQPAVASLTQATQPFLGFPNKGSLDEPPFFGISRAPHLDKPLTVPLLSLLGLYSLGCALLLLSAMSSPELSKYGLAVSSAFLTPAVLVHAVSCTHSRFGQLLGVAVGLSFPPLLVLAPATSRPEPLALLAVAAALFYFVSALRCCTVVKVIAIALSGLCLLSATEACRQSHPNSGWTWGVMAACLSLQAIATSASLAHFDLVCALRPR